MSIKNDFFCTSLKNLCFPTRSRNIFTYKKCQETEGKKTVFTFLRAVPPLSTGCCHHWGLQRTDRQRPRRSRSVGAEEQRSRGETLETTDGAPAISTPGVTTPTLVAAVATLSMRGMKGRNRSGKYLLPPASFNTFL